MKNENGVAKKVMTIQDFMKDDFLGNHYNEIASFAGKHSEKLGYTFVFVNKDLTVDSLDFIEGKFDRKKFIHVIVDYQINPFNDPVEDTFNLYFIILFNDKKTIMFYRTYAILRTSKMEEIMKLNPGRSHL